VAFIRQHMLMGDPLTGLGRMTKRRAAGSGTMMKAARHRAVRLRRMGDPFISPAAMAQMAKAGVASGPKVGGFLSGAGKFLGNIGKGIFGDMGKLDPRSAQAIGGALGKAFA